MFNKISYFLTPSIAKMGRVSTNRNPHTGENALSIQIANYLKAKTITGEFKGVWTKISHETSSRSFKYGILMKNMGKNPGVADFIFTKPGHCLWLELKTGKKQKLSPTQQAFKSWCMEEGLKYLVAASLEETIEFLHKDGFLCSG